MIRDAKILKIIKKVLAIPGQIPYNRYIPIIRKDFAMRTQEELVAARTKAQSKYDKNHTAGFYMKLNTGTDRDILAWLDQQDSKQGAIKRLIRDEIRRCSQ